MRLFIGLCYLLLVLCVTAGRARTSLRQTLANKLKWIDPNDSCIQINELSPNANNWPSCTLVPYPAVPGTVLQKGSCWNFMDCDQGVQFQGIFQDDGNLVIYASDSSVIWATNIYGGATLAVQTDGNLVIYPPNGAAVWASNTAGKGASYFALYYGQFVVVEEATSTITWISPDTSALQAYYKKYDANENDGKGPIRKEVGDILKVSLLLL